MGEVTNVSRAAWARLALRAYGEQTGRQGDYNLFDRELFEEVAVDLIADVLHAACEAGAIDVDYILECARDHFDHEQREEG